MNERDRFRFKAYGLGASGCMFFVGMSAQSIVSLGGRVGALLLFVPLIAATYLGLRAYHLWKLAEEESPPPNE